MKPGGIYGRASFASFSTPAWGLPRGPRTTKLYDRTSDDITLDEVERIGI